MCAFLFVYSLAGELFLSKIVKMNLTYSTIVRPIKARLHFNICFISKYFAIRSNWRWWLIIWTMSMYLQMVFQLWCYCSTVTYRNCNKKNVYDISRSSCPEVICKKAALKTMQNSQKNTCLGVSLQAFRSAALLKRDSSTDVFLWFCEIFKNTYFKEYLLIIWGWKIYLFINQRVLSQIFFQIFLRLWTSLGF